MTDEEKREQILKRALPALFVTIIYFVFISDIMGEQAAKVREEHTQLMRRGISPATLPSIYKQQEQAREKLNSLKTEQDKYAAEIKKMAGFLSSNTDTTETTALSADILAKYNLRVTKELNEPYVVKKLPLALKEVRSLLQPDNKAKKDKEETINVQHLWLQGRFNNMYSALVEMNNAKLSAIPVNFMMSIPKQGQQGELDWELLLWM